MEILETMNLNAWDQTISVDMQEKALHSLEQGKVLYFPFLPFKVHHHEEKFLSPLVAHPKSKNISYDMQQDRLGGAHTEVKDIDQLKEMVKRFASQSRNLFDALFPHYSRYCRQAKTSFRPIESSNRKISKYKDDTLLHVDSFPSNPVKGERILRIFSNVNPHGKPRVWRIGEPFTNVVEKMAPRVKQPWPGSAYFLKLFRLTKDYRTLYDHYMLKIHDAMKLDPHYQKHVFQWEIHFPAGSTWIVYTDQVSHAAMSGQHLFEQTFHLPIKAMKNPDTTPQRVLEKFLQQTLV
ncbi:MAG: Kdo hydroxylase family protein [Parachlamydiaceae bacterium]